MNAYTRIYTRAGYILILTALFFAVTLASPTNNASVTVFRKDNHQLLQDAVVKIIPLANQNSKGAIVGFTNTQGVYSYSFTQPVIIQIMYFGYSTITDTCYQMEDRTYYIAPVSMNIQDVVVTGQYGSNSAQKSVYEVKVISNDMIRAKGASNLREALQNEVNIDLGQDQVFGSYLGINGISGEGVKVMVDGVPIVGRLDGKLDLSQVNINNIERIEIVEGPLSAMYGPDAMGGVINIITKSFQQEKVNVNLKGYYESVGQYNVELDGGFAFKKSQIFLSAGRNFFNGYSTLGIPRFKEWKPKEQYFADAKYMYTGNKFRIAFAGSFFRELMLDRSTPYKSLSYDNGDTAWTYIGIDGHYLTYRPRASFNLTYRFAENFQLETMLAYSGFIRFTNTYSKDLVTQKEELVKDPSTQDTTRYHQIVFRAMYTMPAWKERVNFQFGVDVNAENVTESNIQEGKQKIGDYAVFGSVRLKLVEGLDIQPAVRFSYNTKFTVPLIPSLNIRYNYKDQLVVRASYGRGYRAPSLKELYLEFFDSNHALKGNSDLRPEDGHNVTASINYTGRIKQSHTLSMEVSGFYNNIHNKIDWKFFPAVFPPDTYQYFNVKNYVTYGGEAGLTYRWKGLQMNTSTVFTAYQLGNISGGEKVKMWSPDFRANVSYLIPKAEIGISVTYKYTGKKPLFSVSSDVETGTRNAYHLLDASLSRNFWKDRIQLTIGGKNLLGVTNVMGNNVGGVSLAHNATPNVVNVGWGRTFFTSLVLHFGK